MSRLSAWKRWQAAAGPWRGWAVCPALTMPAGADDDAARSVAPELAATLTPFAPAEDASALAYSLRPGGAAVILDLDPVLGVHTATELSRQRLAHVVLVLPRWPHADAVLRTDQLAATLLVAAARLSLAAVHSNVVFVLDGERETSIRRLATDQRADNRYAMSVGDLPNLATLRAAGIQRLLRVTAAR
jgi:hypothetical protein